MPHINRIRVNNVKYNFGTQFYDDFMMRFSCKNTIFCSTNCIIWYKNGKTQRKSVINNQQ